jgi:kynurenine formamidase
MKIIDLSVPLEDESGWAPRLLRTRVKHQAHKFGRWAIWWMFGVRKKHLPRGLGWANDHLSLSTHGTTHIDAPWHYAPTCGDGPAKTIDQVPLDWCYAPGVVLDMRHIEPTGAISVAEIEAALTKIGYVLKPRDIVLMKTGGDRRLGSPDYFTLGPGVSAEATRYLCDQGVRLMGIDGWSWEAPLPQQAREAKATGRSDIFWAAHFVGLEREYCQIERLTNLDALPPFGFTVCAFPLKVKDGSAGPARVVALIPEDGNSERR